MKILTFITSLSLSAGGPSRSVPMMAKGLANNGVDITLMTVRSEDMNIHALENSNVKLKILEKNYNIKEVEDFIVSEKFDIIQGQSIWDPRYHKIKIIADKNNIPYITTPRGMLEPWSLEQKKWKKKMALWLYQFKDLQTSACIFTTAELEAQHIRKLGINAPLSIIPNGIEIDNYQCRTSIKDVKKQVLFLSRIHEKKGIELLLDAWKSISNINQGWELVISGNGDENYIKSLKEKIANLDLQNNTRIIPPTFGKEKYQLYCESSLFILPSYSENFGMVIAEAMSCGVPVITTNNTPWKSLNDGYKYNNKECPKLGWCIDLNKENIIKALEEAIHLDENTLYEMGQFSSKYIKEHFDYMSVAQKVKKLYEWILGQSEEPDFMYI